MARIPTPASQGAQRIGAVQLGQARTPFMNVDAPVEAFGGGDAAAGLVAAGNAAIKGVDTLVDVELQDRKDAADRRMMKAQNESGAASVAVSAQMLSTQRGGANGSTDAALAEFDKLTQPILGGLTDEANHVSVAEEAATKNLVAAHRRALETSGRNHERTQGGLYETDLSNTAMETAQQLAAINPNSPTAINIALAQAQAAADRLSDSEGVDPATKAQRNVAASGSVMVAAINGALNNNNTGRAAELLEAAKAAKFLTDDQLILVEGEVNGKKDAVASEDLFRVHYIPDRPLPEIIDAIQGSDASQEVKDLSVSRAKKRHAVDVQAKNEVLAENFSEASQQVLSGIHPSNLPLRLTRDLTIDELAKLATVYENFNDRPDDRLLAAAVYTAFDDGTLADFKSSEAAQVALGATGSNAQRDWVAGKWLEARTIMQKAAAAADKAQADADKALFSWDSELSATSAINDALRRHKITLPDDPEDYGAIRERIGEEMDAAKAAGDPITTVTQLNHLVNSLAINELYDMEIKGVPPMLIDDAFRALIAAGYSEDDASDDDVIRKVFGRSLMDAEDSAAIEAILANVPQKK